MALADAPRDADAAADLIELLVDSIDAAGCTPDVSSVGLGDEFRLAVEVLVEGGDLRSFEQGVAIIHEALEHAGIDVSSVVGVEPSFEALQRA